MERPHDCITCPANALAQGFTKPEGKAKLGVAIFGEKAGPHEIQELAPMRPNSESGSLITHVVEKNLRLSRSDFVWDLAVKCRPIGDKIEGTSFERDVTSCCNNYNRRSLASPEVKVIVALGAVAFRALTGIEGKKRDIQNVRGYIYQSDYGLVLPSLDPAFIRKGNSRYTGALIHDIKKALGVASGNITSYDLHPSYSKPHFVLDGKLEALVSLYYKLRDNPKLPIFYDIETPWSATAEEEDKQDLDEEEEEEHKLEEGHDPYVIKSIQFAYDKHWAITVPWIKPFIKVAIKILGLANRKGSFNGWHFDDCRLERNGAIINGLKHDYMWMWKHVQPGLDKGLQKVASFCNFPYPWKHFALDTSMDDIYGGSDVIALAYIDEVIPARLRQMGVWESYLRYKVRYRDTLKAAEIRGFPVNEIKRQEVASWLEEGVKREDGILQALVPAELRNITPKRKDKKTGELSFGYIREPKIITSYREAYNRTRDAILAKAVLPSKRLMPFEQWAESKAGLSFREFGGVGGGIDKDGSEVAGRWCNVEPFKASKDQLVRYMKSKGYEVPTKLKTRKETTGKKELIEVYEKTEDEVLRSVIKIRSMGKMLTNDIPGWMPLFPDSNGDGSVHTTFKFDPPNWQLNSVGPNIQNARKHAADSIARELDLGTKFRQIVQAPPGRCVVEFDKRSFHVSMMGYEARDPLYLKWSKVDMHTLITSYIVNEPIPLEGEPDLEKISYIKKKFKVVRDTQGKPTVLGNQLGLGATKLFYTNKTYVDENGQRQVGIKNRKTAEWLQGLIADLFPITHKYKSRIKEQAHYQSWLKSEYGAVRWFFDVMRWDYASKSMKNGTEAEQAQSHNVQADAFGMIHDEILEMDDVGLLEEYWFANTVHDSVIMFPRVEQVEQCFEDVTRIMNVPSKVLVNNVVAPDGLVVMVDISASKPGGNWAPGHKDKNPMGIFEVKY